MTNPKQPGTYLVTQVATKDSASLPDNLKWKTYREWVWNGNNWLDEIGSVCTNLTGCEGWEKIEG